jgi:hypothetical protein
MLNYNESKLDNFVIEYGTPVTERLVCNTELRRFMAAVLTSFINTFEITQYVNYFYRKER